MDNKAMEKYKEIVKILGTIEYYRNNAVLVSRHEATIKLIQEILPEIKTFSGNVNPEDVENKIVIGNIPLHLCAKAREVYSIEFKSFPPRGEEWEIEKLLENISIEVYTVFTKETLRTYKLYISGKL